MVGHRDVAVGDLRLHIAEEGAGPLVLLLHGFPECWYSWRHQFAPLAGAGYHVVAPDQRGYGRSDRPARVEEYTILHLVGDAIGLIGALGERQAVIIGHDAGCRVAWSAALMRPDVVRGVVGLSVPPPERGPIPPLKALDQRFGGQFYWNYFTWCSRALPSASAVSGNRGAMPPGYPHHDCTCGILWRGQCGDTASPACRATTGVILARHACSQLSDTRTPVWRERWCHDPVHV